MPEVQSRKLPSYVTCGLWSKHELVVCGVIARPLGVLYVLRRLLPVSLGRESKSLGASTNADWSSYCCVGSNCIIQESFTQPMLK